MNSTTGTTGRLTTAMKTTAALGAACALGVLLAACGSQTAANRATTTGQAAAAHPTTPTTATPTAGRPTSAAPTSAAPTTAAIAAAPVTATSAAPAPSTPLTPPVEPVTAVARPTASPTASPAAADGVPHFTTPDASMRYLVAAYNKGNETAIRHVTTPSSRDQFESERQWVKTFRFRSCTANGAPFWDYTCVLDIITTMPGVPVTTDPATGKPVMDEVTVLVAPAARTGFYLEANEGCGG